MPATELKWTRREIALTLIGWLVVAAVFTAVAGATQGTYDTYRDLWFAAGIVRGVEFPLVGPGINQTFHLGPLWYYLLAVFLAALPPGLAAASLTGLVVAARFPLAYAAGRALGGRGTGLWAVALMALPGWWMLALGVVTHTAAVGAAVLWLVLATLAALRHAHWTRHLMLGLAGAVAFHAHPTTLPLAAVAAALALRQTPGGRMAPAAVCLALPGLVLIAPYLLSGGLAADLEGIGRYTGELAQAPNAIRFLMVPVSMVALGPIHALWIWAGLEWTTSTLLAISPWVIACAALIAGLRAHRGRELRICCAFLALFLTQCAFLVLIRPVSPPWMVFSLVPLLVLAVAPLCARGFGGRMQRLSLASVAGLAVLGSALALAGLAAPARGTEGWWPQYRPGSPGLMSVTELPVGRVRMGPPLAPLRSVDALLVNTCTPLQLHGQLALLADRSLGYPWRLACGAADSLHLGGTPVDGALHQFGMWHPQVMAYCEEAGTEVRMPADPVLVLNATPALALGDPRRYPPRTDLGVATTEQFRRHAPSDLLYVGTVLPGYAPLRLQAATVNESDARVVAETGAFVVLACQDRCGQEANAWDVVVDALPGTVDIVGFSCAAVGTARAAEQVP